MAGRLRELPAVGRILQLLPPEWNGNQSRRAADAARQVLADARARILSGSGTPDEAVLVQDTVAALQRANVPALRPAINATGVILHTGLGRSVLAEEAAENLRIVASQHSTLEIDEQTGQRGSRLAGVASILSGLVGCEDALVVNNNAAAVLLAIETLANRRADQREVVISRGQLVEIGGQFRIPDVIAAAGARLVEVGTTNKTHFKDYEQAIGPQTSLLLHVHPSNFRVVGFTSEVPLEPLAALARSHRIPFMADLGSGALVDLTAYGVPGEPTVQQIHTTGVDICTWSGDKLLGGPQCGIITGRHDLIAEMKRRPLMRALRVDKLILAALEATLRLYRDEASALKRVPTLRAITRQLEEIHAAACRLRDRLRAADVRLEVEVVSTVSQVGGGSMPGEELPSAAICLADRDLSPDEMAHRLRTGDPPVFGRITKGKFLLDLRTVSEEEEEKLVLAILHLDSA